MTTDYAPDLFSQMCLPPVTFPGARTTDPITSHLAVADPANQVRWGTQRFRLLEVYVTDGGPLTDEEAGHRIGMDHVRATRRLSELRKAGLIIFDGTFAPTSTGCASMRCTVTEAGRRAHEAAKR